MKFKRILKHKLNMETNKKIKVAKLIATINLKLESGEIREKFTSEESGCKYCVMNDSCNANYLMPCMAHNRISRDSVYYSSINSNSGIKSK